MDTILEQKCLFYGLPNQSKPITSDDQELLLAIIRLTKTLWDNGTNRNLYNSYQVDVINVAFTSLVDGL